MKLRDATYADMDQITRCAKDFFAYANFAQHGLTLDVPSFETMVGGHIEHGIVLLLIGDDGRVHGGIAGMPGPWGFNNNITVMLELFFWIDPEYRAGTWAFRMLSEYERRARTAGADIMAMVSVGTHLEEGVRKLYERFGYAYGERFYYKQLGVGRNA